MRFLLLLTLLPLTTPPLSAAPVPPPKARPLCVIGQWRMTWSGCPWRAEFHTDGRYIGESEHSSWHGSWRLKGDTLTVSEWPATRLDCTPFVWSVKLCRDGRALTGGGNGSVAVRLER